MEPQYRRVLLKLSGEAMAGEAKAGLDFDTVLKICGAVKKCADLGVQIGVVVGGGNFWRGRLQRQNGPAPGRITWGCWPPPSMPWRWRTRWSSWDCDVRVQTAIAMNQIAEPYIRNRAVRHMEKGRVVIFGCGTGNPFFSTDTAAALRAAEIEADVILKASMVDGVYDSDPKINPDAVQFDSLDFMDVLNRDLKVMDSTAATLCKDNQIPILVFNLNDPENIVRAICGEKIGTLVH